MKNFFSFQALEFKRFFRIHKLAVFFLVFILLFLSVSRNSVSFKRELSMVKEFQVNEAETFSKMLSYTEYSKSGIRFLISYINT